MKELLYSFKSTVKHYVNGGMFLILATILALVAANSPLSESYFSWWNNYVSINIGDLNLIGHGEFPLTVLQFINDALMAVFFFSVGLEIKKEMLVGELSSPKKAMLPIIAAVGGMILPVGMFLLFSDSDTVARGAAIPMATDIAFSLGVLGLLGTRVPISLKIFLTALAVVDDIGGITVIALFYSGHLAVEYLLYSLVLFAILIIGAQKGIHSRAFYIVIGLVIWFLFLNSGIHPTIAGVLVAFCVPAHPKLDTQKYINRIKENISQFPTKLEHVRGGVVILSKDQIDLLKSVESASDNVVSPLQRLEDILHPLVVYFIIPLFAFANAGIDFSQIEISKGLSGAALPVLAGLLIGKFVGIFSFSYLSIKTKLVSMPTGVNFWAIAGVALLGGIGFTVSIFIANLSYPTDTAAGVDLLNQAKFGVLAGSFIAGVGGYYLTKYALRNHPEKS
ncbi:MAG: Na+/H+ antiporter NhaA [Rikenellaceae bacterium]